MNANLAESVADQWSTQTILKFLIYFLISMVISKLQSLQMNQIVVD